MKNQENKNVNSENSLEKSENKIFEKFTVKDIVFMAIISAVKLIPFLTIYLAIFYFASNRNLTFTYQMAIRLSAL